MRLADILRNVEIDASLRFEKLPSVMPYSHPYDAARAIGELLALPPGVAVPEITLCRVLRTLLEAEP